MNRLVVAAVACFMLGTITGARIGAAEWTFKADPRPTAATGPAPTTAAAIRARLADPFLIKTPLKLTSIADRQLALPLTHTRYILFYGRFGSKNPGWEVFDLGQGTKVHQGPALISLRYVTLSPEGETIMGLSKTDSIEFHSLKTGKLVSTVNDSQGRINKPRIVGFIDAKSALISNAVGEEVSLDVVDVATGKIRNRAATDRVFPDLVISPGGHYAAYTNRFTIKLVKLDEAGALIEIPFQHRMVADTVQGLAFSPDGKELAALLNVREQFRFLCIDMATGKTAFDEILKIEAAAKAGGAHEGFEYLADGSGWLVRNRWVVNAGDFQLTHEFPEEQRPLGRWLASSKDMLVAADVGKTIDIKTVNSSEVAGSAKERDFDFMGRLAWNLKPVAHKPGALPVTRPVLLGELATWKASPKHAKEMPEIRRCFLQDSGESALLCISRAESTFPAAFQAARVELPSGKATLATEFEDKDLVLDGSPDAKQVVLWRSSSNELGILEHVNGKHELRTHKLPGAIEKPVAGAFLAEGRFLLQTSKQVLCLRLPTQVEWTATGSFTNAPLTLTADRKLAAIATIRGIAFFDTASGGKVAHLCPAAGTHVASLRFSPQGDQLAAVCSAPEDYASKVQVYNLATGNVQSETVVPGATGLSTVSFCAGGYLLVSQGNTHLLVSPEKNRVLWQYGGADLLRGPVQTSTSLLFAVLADKKSDGALVPLELPGKPAIDRAAKLPAGDPFIWKPGNKVMLKLVTVAGQDAQKIIEDCKGTLKMRGMELVDKSDNVLQANCYLKVGEAQTYQEQDTDRTITVPHKAYGCHVTLTVGGAVLWSDGVPENLAPVPQKTGSIIVWLNPGETLQQGAERKLAGQRPNYIACPPAYIYKNGSIPMGTIQRDGTVSAENK